MSAAIDRVVQDYLSHLSVERGLADNTIRSYRRDLRRYADFLHAARSDGADGDHRERHRGVPGFAAYRRRRPLGARHGQRRPHHRVGAWPAPIHGARTARDDRRHGGGETPTTGRAAAEGACRSATSRRSSRRQARPARLSSSRDRALLEVLYGTGARISEAVGIDLDDLDLEDSTVLLTRQGRQAAHPPGRVVRPRLADRLPHLVASSAGVGTSELAGGVPQRPRWPAVAAERVDRAHQGCQARRAHRQTSLRTRCGTRSPPICWTAERTYASCRSSSDTPR